MKGKCLIICAFLGLLFAPLMSFGQKNSQITIVSRVSSENFPADGCKELRLGEILNIPEPNYPSGARSKKIGGKVEINLKIDEDGNVLKIEKIAGNEILQGAAMAAAKKAKFSPTLCDGKKVSVNGFITFSFFPYLIFEIYTTPRTIADFADIKKESPFYNVIFELTENYKIAYGYGDGNFHAELPLKRGDLAQFLRLTLEMLSAKAKLLNRNLPELKIYAAFNPQKINSAGKVKDLKKNQPFYDSVKILLQTYDIAVIDENFELRGGANLTQNELIEIWTNIFGVEAIPVNFEKTSNYEKIVSRGEFAVFLSESLEVLSYRLTP